MRRHTVLSLVGKGPIVHSDGVLDFIVGVDPGKSGGIVGMYKRGGSIGWMEPMPLTGRELNISEFIFLLQKRPRVVHVFIEHAQAFRGQGVVSTFNYAREFGMIVGVLYALKIPFTLVKPHVWQKEMFTGTVADLPPKVKAFQVVQRLFPDTKFLISTRSKKPHDGLIDACLIAEWGRRRFR